MIIFKAVKISGGVLVATLLKSHSNLIGYQFLLRKIALYHQLRFRTI